MARSMMDYVDAVIAAKEKGGITYEEWCKIRRNGTPEEIAEAVERMNAAGGYENLQ